MPGLGGHTQKPLQIRWLHSAASALDRRRSVLRHPAFQKHHSASQEFPLKSRAFHWLKDSEEAFVSEFGSTSRHRIGEPYGPEQVAKDKMLLKVRFQNPPRFVRWEGAASRKKRCPNLKRRNHDTVKGRHGTIHQHQQNLRAPHQKDFQGASNLKGSQV